MAGRGYTIFDTGLGRCAVAWSEHGIVGILLPESREIETRKRVYRLYPDAREMRPTPDIQIAMAGIATQLRGGEADFSGVRLDLTDVPGFNQRVYQYVRAIPRGATRTYGEVAADLRATGAVSSVAQAIARNPFMVIVPCHRVLDDGGYPDKMSPNGGVISKRRLLSLEGAYTSRTLFDVLLPVASSRPHP